MARVVRVDTYMTFIYESKLLHTFEVGLSFGHDFIYSLLSRFRFA